MNRNKYRKVVQVFFYVILLFGLCANQYLYAQTKVIEPISRVFYGNSRTNCTDGEYVYIGAGGTISIGRIVSADSVSILSECYLPSMVEDVIINNKTLFVSDLLTGLHIFNLEDILRPREIGRLYFPYRSYGMILWSTNLFISHGSNGVSKIDITNLSHPISLLKERFPCSQLRIYTDYLYCINYNKITIAPRTTLDSLNALPVSDIFWGEIKGLEFSNNKGILVENYSGLENWSYSSLTFLDLSNPIAPKRYKSLNLPIQSSFTNTGDTVLCFTSDTLYTIVLNSNSSPYIIAKSTGIPGDFASIRDTLLLVSRDSHSDFQLVNIKDIVHPQKGFYLSTLANIGSVAAADSFLVAGRSEGSGLFLVDIRDISNPCIKQEYTDNIGSVRGLQISNGHVFAASQQGLKIFDVVDLDKLKLIGELNYGYWAMNISVFDTLAVCGGYYYDVHLINVSNPTKPKYITSITMPSSMVVDNIFLRDTLLFINGDYGGIKIYNISSPGSPELIWEKYFNSCEAGCVSGNILFVSDYSTIHAFDISQTSNPVELASYGLDRRITGINVEDSLAFVSVFSNGYYSDNGMVILDVRNCNSMKEIKRANTPGFSNSIFANNRYIFLTDNEDGLYIFDRKNIITNISRFADNLIPSGFKLYQNYPNPFNPTTTIEYGIPKSGLVTIKIYDVLGREVKTLINQYQNIGSHEINYVASNLSSGVYFYQLKAGNFISTKKMVLLK
ncbi:MAG TPA: T9SS type A sorting domain-containing protein [Ignavibacteriaceae bacterium]|nr:T9SS type A sorting domain-containing protein [Ignavibacteriaceae bacterium]